VKGLAGSPGRLLLRTVAVMGNPNSGKSTVFNRLTGLSQKVANYPGVTVEKKVGRLGLEATEARLVDLPGTYSLAAHSPDEMVAVDLLLGNLPGEGRPDLVLEVVDASNLERNLYLLSQVLDLGVPVVVALNMVDVAAARGVRIDAALLSKKLGVPVVATEAHRGVGIPELERAIEAELQRPPADRAPARDLAWADGPLSTRVDGLLADLDPAFERARGRRLHRFEVLRALVDRGGHAEERLVKALGDSLRPRIEAARGELENGSQLVAKEANARYAWAREAVRACLSREERRGAGWSERIDRLLTHRVLGLAIFAAMMLLVFQSIFAWARPLMEGVETVFRLLGASVESALPPGALRSLLVDGVISGAGMVVVFLPQIIILFFFIGLLEDCGYMARAAFLMDKVMSKCGLSGKSFIPMLSGFACAVPGIMAARVIEDRRDRLATILVTPLMSCSARLPVYTIFIATFIPDRPVIPGVLGLRALTLFSLYALGIVTAVAVAWALRRTLLRGARAPFVLELPSYKWPSPRALLLRLHQRARAFLLRAGTLILAIAVVVWGLAYFPHSPEIASRYAAERARVERETVPGPEQKAALRALREEESGAFLRDSFFGRLGRAVEPAFRPLGWDWRISMAAIASFPAREVVVATLGTIYNLGEEPGADPSTLRKNLENVVWPDGRRVFNVPVALSIMVFFALCCQCGATLAIMRRETGSWGWPVFAFTYMTGLAYLGALCVYQAGMALS
jgi:ferrous iron transport protein B